MWSPESLASDNVERRWLLEYYIKIALHAKLLYKVAHHSIPIILHNEALILQEVQKNVANLQWLVR